MGKILEKLMKKYWKNAKNTGKVYEKILEKCKKNWKSQGNSSVQKSGNHDPLSWGICSRLALKNIRIVERFTSQVKNLTKCFLSCLLIMTSLVLSIR